jgi:hypothetical protein
MTELSEAEKATFKAATERRKANGVRLKRFSVMAEESQIIALNELWSAWTERFGKITAIDHLIVLWGRAEARLRDLDEVRQASDRSKKL